MNDYDCTLILKTDSELKAYLDESLKLQDATFLGRMNPETGLLAVGKDHLVKTQQAPFPMVLLWVDDSHCPSLDIRDICRVHAMEGDGDLSLTWMFVNEHRLECYFVLEVEMHTPVHVSFRVPIRMREWSDLLRIISQTGTLVLFPGPPPAWREKIETLSEEEFLAAIWQAGGGLNVTMDDKVQNILSSHFQAYTARLIRKIESLDILEDVSFDPPQKMSEKAETPSAMKQRPRPLFGFLSRFFKPREMLE